MEVHTTSVTITIQKNNIIGITLIMFFLGIRKIKTLTASRNPPDFEELEH